MTRKRLDRTLKRLYVVVALTLLLSLVARFADRLPWLDEDTAQVLLGLYDYVKDMSLLIATAGVAYVTNIFQKRSTFVQNLEREWRGIVKTKSALFAFCERQYPALEDYVETFCRLSETIDNMRIIYQNVGETDELIGLYPYAPLHDMRRALQTLDPRNQTNVTPEQRRLVRDTILQCFYAIRETFLEELDLEMPDKPLLVMGARRAKKSGALKNARELQSWQAEVQRRVPVTRPDIDEFLRVEYQKEVARGQG